MAKKHMRILAAILFLISFCFHGCGGDAAANVNVQNIESFIEKVLTVPSPELSYLSKLDLHLTDMEKYDKQFYAAVESLCGENADIEKLADTGSRFYGQVIYLHLMANAQDYVITVSRVTVTESEEDDKHYGYEAVIQDSREEESSTLTGSIQLNDAYQIEYMSIN